MEAGDQLTACRQHQQPGYGNESRNGGGDQCSAIVQQHPPCVEWSCHTDRNGCPENGRDRIIHQCPSQIDQNENCQENIWIGQKHQRNQSEGHRSDQSYQSGRDTGDGDTEQKAAHQRSNGLGSYQRGGNALIKSEIQSDGRENGRCSIAKSTHEICRDHPEKQRIAEDFKLTGFLPGGSGYRHVGHRLQIQMQYGADKHEADRYRTGQKHQRPIGHHGSKPGNDDTGSQRNQTANNTADGQNGAIFLWGN